MAAIAAVFAGQGAQFVGMGRELAASVAECKALFDRADDVLGYGISRICFEGPEEELTRSDHCQPAIFVTSVACHAAWMRAMPGLEIRAAAGLSLGEWTALHVAGALTFEDALRVLEARGRFMQDACEAREGGMVSVIGLGGDALGEICRSAGVEVSNVNSGQQVVLSGERAAVGKAEELAKAAGARRTVVLRVAGAYHSSLMAPAAERLREFLREVEIRPCRLPVVANVTGRPHGGPEDIRRDMVRQVTEPVQWLSCVEWFGRRGIDTYVECGPGNVLSGLIKRIDSAAALHGIQDPRTLDRTVQSLQA
jgi:[acyl-carrier-protein] S-malonyltransferase